MQRWVAQRLDRIITGSEASARSVVEEFGVGPEHVRWIHDGVDTEVFRSLPDVAPEPNRVLFVGNSDDRNKGVRYLLRALRQLRGEVPFHLRIVHKPASRIAHKLVHDLGLHARVTFMENLRTEELVHQYNRAQVVVSPSLYEGFGLPAAEALACGTPVIATAAGALGEIVEDGVSGVIVPPGQVGPLAAAIRSMLEDPEQCRRMGLAGADRIRERFNWRRTAEQTVDLYGEVLGRRRQERLPSLSVVSGRERL
jgi:glycosyltransferase involved in cell wall biosynthesis